MPPKKKELHPFLKKFADMGAPRKKGTPSPAIEAAQASAEESDARKAALDALIQGGE